MKRAYYRCLPAVALLLVIVVSIALPCFADGETSPGGDGDPIEDVPMSRTLDPTAGILSDVWMILMAMAFQLAL